MTEILSLKTFVNERLTSAAEDIFGMFEKTINEYHAEVSRLNEELRNQRRQLETVLHPNKPLHRADSQQVIINDAERKYCHEQQQCELDWRTNVIEVMDEPAPQQIKEEEELHRTSQKEERNHGLESDSRECVLTQTFDKQSQFSNTYLTRSMKNMTAEPPHKLSNQKEGKHVVQKQACKINSIEASHPKSPDESQPVYSCKVCGNTFHYKGNLVRHVRLHTKDAECRCGVCGDSYLEATELKVHLRTHKSFQCTVCGKILVNGSSLKVHMRTHTAEKPHCCKVCGRGFKQMGHLIVHTRTHTREKPHCCNICNRGFNQMVHLSVHMRTHTGEKPFSCHVCGKGFVSRGNLVQHIRVHSGDKPFICNDCGKTFTKRTSLNYHMRIHIEEKTFCCHICGQDICTSEDLEKHMLIHINTC